MGILGKLKNGVRHAHASAPVSPAGALHAENPCSQPIAMRGASHANRGGITRRNLAKATAATGAAALVASALTGCGDDKVKQTTGEPQVVEDKNLTVVLEDYEQSDQVPVAAQSWTLPLGTVLFHTGGSWAAAMIVPQSAQYPNSLAALSLSSGKLTTLIDGPTQGRGWSFHDVRLGDGVLAWSEMRYATGDWVLMAQQFQAGTLTGEAQKLDEGDADWEPPLLDAADDSVVWLHMPLSSGSKRAEKSHCYLWKPGDSKGESLYTSPGRFAAAPRISGSVLTIVPRVNEDEGTYYGMVALNLATSDRKELDRLVLPSGVRPLDAVYLGERFAFSIEAAYNGVGSLGNMGSFFGREGGPYVYLGREPVCCPAGDGSSRYVVKVQSSHYLVDVEDKTFAVIAAPDRCLDFGDYPATSGQSSTLLTYATIRDDKGLPANVTARLFSI